jgi:outer membrane protein assembly factor BamB
VLFTQDQRDSAEVVAAYDAGTGDELWTHEDVDPQRFEESMGGPGPRATPTFADGKIYTLGAKGIFNCLDAVTGKPHWQRDIAKDAGAAVPMWAFSSSPLVEGDLVYVFAGSEKGKNLLAYHADSGEPAWTAIAGKHSYSSPQLAVLGGQRQILFVGEDTVSAFEPTTGEMLWQHKGPPNPQYASIQPNVVGDSQVLVSLCPDVGTTLLEVTRTGGASAENSDADAWQVEEKWNTRDIKPFFNDFVLHDGFLYGFDNEIFCCVDLATGKRRWKGGRYSTGQVLLLADQSLLLVMAEAGEAVLVAAEPQAHRELGRFTPLTAKTWNHPVIVGSRLYVRNSEEMACFELTPAS